MRERDGETYTLKCNDIGIHRYQLLRNHRQSCSREGRVAPNLYEAKYSQAQETNIVGYNTKLSSILSWVSERGHVCRNFLSFFLSHRLVDHCLRMLGGHPLLSVLLALYVSWENHISTVHDLLTLHTDTVCDDSRDNPKIERKREGEKKITKGFGVLGCTRSKTRKQDVDVQSNFNNIRLHSFTVRPVIRLQTFSFET